MGRRSTRSLACTPTRTSPSWPTHCPCRSSRPTTRRSWAATRCQASSPSSRWAPAPRGHDSSYSSWSGGSPRATCRSTRSRTASATAWRSSSPSSTTSTCCAAPPTSTSGSSGVAPRPPRLAVTLGDPRGIGPEVMEKALALGPLDAEVVIVGSGVQARRSLPPEAAGRNAGQGGLFGDEDERVLPPAARALGAAGPLPADTVFVRALKGEFDAVLTPYHDVGMTAVKVAGFGKGVNVTLGLPFPRVAPDHGTALDIAGRGIADPGSMRAALELAAQLARVGR